MCIAFPGIHCRFGLGGCPELHCAYNVRKGSLVHTAYSNLHKSYCFVVCRCTRLHAPEIFSAAPLAALTSTIAHTRHGVSAREQEKETPDAEQLPRPRWRAEDYKMHEVFRSLFLFSCFNEKQCFGIPRRKTMQNHHAITPKVSLGPEMCEIGTNS